MTDSRNANLVVEGLVQPSGVEARDANLVVEGLVQPSDIEVDVANLVVEVLIPVLPVTHQYGWGLILK